MTDGGRLGIMHDKDIVVIRQESGALLVRLEIECLLRLSQAVVGPLQGIVEGLGDREEFRPAVDQPPVGRESQGMQRGQMAGEQFGHPAPERR